MFARTGNRRSEPGFLTRHKFPPDCSTAAPPTGRTVALKPRGREPTGIPGSFLLTCRMSSEDPKFAKRMAERRALSQPDGNQVSPVPTDDRGDTQAAGSAAAHKRTSRGLVSDQEFLAQQKVRIGDLQSPLPGEESASGSPEKTVWVSYGTGPVDRQAQQSSRPSSAAGSSLSNISTSRTHSAQGRIRHDRFSLSD